MHVRRVHGGGNGGHVASISKHKTQAKIIQRQQRLASAANRQAWLKHLWLHMSRHL
jgi:hypothetical protein